MQCPAIRATTAGHRLHHIGALARIADALGHFAYLIETPVFGLIVAARDSVALALLGIPLTVTWGLSAFITNYIPNVGIIIGVVPPALLGLLTGGPHLMVIVIVVYCALNFVVQSIIQPRFIGDAVGCRSRSRSWPGVLGVAARPLGRHPGHPAHAAGERACSWMRTPWPDEPGAWLRASAKEPDPAAPPKRKPRPHRTGRAQPRPRADVMTPNALATDSSPSSEPAPHH